MLQVLSPPDVILFLLFTAAAIAYIFFRQFTLARRALALLILFAIATPLSYLFIHPPLTVDWQKFRDLDRAGKIQYKLMAPIPYSANDYQRDIPDAALKPPSRQHLLGTEVNGGDVLSRMIHACRIALSIGVVSTGISVIIGVTIGGLMGYFAGRLDLFGMRLIEIFEAIPTLFLLITFVAFFGRNLYLIMAIIGITGWTDEARFIRAEFLRLRKQDFVHAAVASGLPLRSILFRHLLPNGISPILVTTSFGIASAILYESVLSFLGIGLVEEPSWGQMLNQARGVGGSFVWWIALYPGLAIFLTVFTYNLLGEALRDALDPKLRT
jgi:peptide/nickel transport system permease protein